MRTTKDREAWTPPAGSGVFYSHRPNRPSPFLLRWKAGEGQDEGSAAFKDADDRERAAKALVDRRQTHGDAILQFDAARWLKYLEFQAIVGPDVDPVIVAHEWRASKQGTPRAVGLLVPEAVARYMALKVEENAWGADSLRHVTKALADRFAPAFASKRLNDVSADDVRDWLFGKVSKDGKRVGALCDDKGRPLGSYALKHHLKIVRTFFERAVVEGWGAIGNPAVNVASPRCVDGDPIVIELRAAFDFFKANRDQRVIGRIALEAFGAVRYSTAGKLQKAAINFDARGIRMAAQIHKSGQKDGKARYRQGHPACLWEWLSRAPDECWAMTPHQYREEKRYAGIRAGVRPGDTSTKENKEKVTRLRNIWRHSFISYHLARYKCPPLTKYLAQHSDEDMTEDYEGIADDKNAARFFMLTPENVALTWEQFMTLTIPEIPLVDPASLAAILRAA